MKLHTYVAAPFSKRLEVLDLRTRLIALGMEWTGNWVDDDFDTSTGAEPSREHCRRHAAQNDADIGRSHAMLLWAAPNGGGGERFAEARLALDSGIPIVWTGEKILSARRDGVLYVPSLDEAIGVLVAWKGLVARIEEPMPEGEGPRATIWKTVVEAHAANERGAA